jgi:glucosamine-6-phosphate deaminase
MRIQQVTDAAEGAALGATLFQELSDLAPDRPVGLATGETMRGVYRALAESGFQPRFDDVFLLDEYLGLPEDSAYSFQHEIQTRFCEPMHYTGRVHVPGRGNYAGPAGPALFEQELTAKGPVSVQLLGIGTNGHIAFNEPGSPRDSMTREVLLAEETREANRRHFPEGHLIPTHAVSQGLGTIARANNLLLLAFGPTKQSALVEGLRNDDLDHPLYALRDHPGFTIVTDLGITDLGITA